MSYKEIREPIVLENEGLKIFGVLHRPDTNNKVPAVAMCHGFAGSKVGKSRIYVRLSERLSKLGIASLRFDYRGCGDSEGNFAKTTLEGKISDTLLALNFLKSHPLIDSRIGVLGRSLGGPVSILSLKTFGAVNCLALWAPVFTAKPWEKEWKEVQNTTSHDLLPDDVVYFHGEFAGKTLFKQVFQMQLEDKFALLNETPLLHVYSKGDEVVRMDQSELYQQGREKVKAPTESLELINSNHLFSNPFEQEDVLDKTTDFFEKYLIGVNALA